MYQRGNVPVLVFFFNPSANPSPALLHGSTLAAVGNIVVVTANYRTAALGFLSTGKHMRVQTHIQTHTQLLDCF